MGEYITMVSTFRVIQADSPEDAIRATTNNHLRTFKNKSNPSDVSTVSIINHHIVPNVKLEDIKIPARVFNVLWRHDIKTISDLIGYSQEELMKFKNMGEIGMHALTVAVNNHGIVGWPYN